MDRNESRLPTILRKENLEKAFLPVLAVTILFVEEIRR
jgi:hypothetical protein